jgi:drug/metabolite transporter (DMT)-like permease
LHLNKIQSQLSLHGIVFIWGFTAILGKLIDLPSEQLVWWRMGLAWNGLWVIGKFLHAHLSNPRNRWKVWGVGALVALHWLCFFEAAKVSNVTVSLLGLSSSAFFTALLEPFLLKRPIDKKEVLLGLITVIGILLAFPFDRAGNLGLGLLYSFGASVFGTLFSTINGLLKQEESAAAIAKHEFLGGFLVLTVFLVFMDPALSFVAIPSWSNMKYLLLLSWICTSFAFLASVYLLKYITPFTVNLTVNLEPVYGILMALLIFNEHAMITPMFYVGAVIVLISVLLNAWFKRKKNLLVVE